jgi:hypothetical protein
MRTCFDEETDALIELLQRYAPFLTSKPGKCNLFEYEFKLTDEKPVRSYTLPVPFSKKPAIREQPLLKHYIWCVVVSLASCMCVT